MMRDNARPMMTRNGQRTLRDTVYHVLLNAGGSLRVKEIFGFIQAQKLYVFSFRDGSGSSNLKAMQASVHSVCWKSPLFPPTERGTYIIAKKYLNRPITDKVKEEEPNANTNNNNNNMMCSPSPYALDLREALESGLMTEEEYAEAVQEAQRYKSHEKKKEIADYNKALRIIFAEASDVLTAKQQFTVKREYLEEVRLCKAPCRPPSKKRRRRKTSSPIVKVKQEE